MLEFSFYHHVGVQLLQIQISSLFPSHYAYCGRNGCKRT